MTDLKCHKCKGPTYLVEFGPSKQHSVVVCHNCSIALTEKVTKPDFDITQHEWSDDPIKYLDNDSSGVELRATESAWFVNFYLDKSDAIALARHFKLTPGDLT